METQNTIIPKAMTGGKDLVVVEKEEYDRLLRFADHKVELRSDIDQAMEEVKQGKVKGPFNSADELMQSLSK